MHVNLDIASYVEEHGYVKSEWQCIFINISWLRVSKPLVTQIWDTEKKQNSKIAIGDPWNHYSINVRMLLPISWIEKIHSWREAKQKQSKNATGR